jgi:hypothetical protein
MGQDPGLSAELTKWALSQGVTIDGIAAHEFPGKGLGIIAQRRLEVRKSLLRRRSLEDIRRGVSSRERPFPMSLSEPVPDPSPLSSV